MEWIVNNWYLIVAAIAIIAMVAASIFAFVNQPTDKQLNKVREWLLYAVTIAEKELGGGTGKIKLRYVYDMFLAKFPWISKTVSFELFSALVDDALDNFRSLLETNEKLQKYILEEK